VLNNRGRAAIAVSLWQPPLGPPDRHGSRRRSFCWSFHLTLLGPTGPHWLDDPLDVSCKDRTRQHAVDGSLLSCNQLLSRPNPL
jgi:hypothetical protein